MLDFPPIKGLVFGIRKQLFQQQSLLNRGYATCKSTTDRQNEQPACEDSESVGS